MDRLRTLALTALLPTLASAQLIVDMNQSPSDLVQNVLLGGGVSVSNITFNGQPGNALTPQAAAFSSAGANVGITNGMMLATGDADLAIGPNTTGSASAGGFTGYSDADLVALAGIAVNDAAVLEFDFIPTGGAISFNFVFASEEYIEFVDQINDAFGFFLSGPGISGPYANNAENIALIPGTNTPVTINTVNNVANAAYYVDNGDGFTAPYNSGPNYIQYDGFTVPLTASHAVQCGQTYHIKIAIGDASDEVYDSAVFLQAGAFASPTSAVELTPDLLLPCMTGGTLDVLNVVGGTAPFEATWTSAGAPVGSGMSLPVVANGEAWYVVTVQDACGGATMDSVLVSTMLPQVVVPEAVEVPCGGQVELEMTLAQVGSGVPVYSWSANGTSVGSSLSLEVSAPQQPTWFVATVTNACGLSTSDSTLVTSAIDPIAISLSPNVLLACDGDGAALAVTEVSGGNGYYHFLWAADGQVLDTNQQITVGNIPQVYSVTVSDDCGATATGTVEVALQAYAPIVVEASADGPVMCAGWSAGASITGVTGGTGSYNAVWTNSNGDTLSTTEGFLTVVNSTETYSVTVTDDCGHTGSAQVTLGVEPHDPLVLSLPDAMVCEGGSHELIAQASGGAGPYHYVWPAFPGADSAVTVSPTALTTYAVSVTDACGLSESAQAQVGVEHPVVTIMAESIGYNAFSFSVFALPGAEYYAWAFGDGDESASANPEHTYADMAPTVASVAVITPNGCMAMDTIALVPAAQLFFPNAFTPDGDGINDTFGPTGLLLDRFELAIFDRWGEEIAALTGVGASWDGRLKNGSIAPTGVYVYSYTAAGERLTETKGLGHVTVLSDASLQR